MLRNPLMSDQGKLGWRWQRLGEVRNRLADDRRLVDNGAPEHTVCLERFPSLPLGELGDRIGRRNEVVKKEPLTPHR